MDGEVYSKPKTRTVDSLHDHDEGVERNGMIWGMKHEEYQALSARERKRVRNRITARTFRAKRRQHISFMDSTLIAMDLEIHQASEENSRLRGELAALKLCLFEYEKKPY
jgi:ABC-type hemin transport system ATPase subunit